MESLVASAATAVVTAMATDGWQQARTAVVSLWRRVHPERVPAIEADLEETRAEIISARRAGDAQAEQDLTGDWQRRLRRLLAADPRLADELRRLLADDLAPAMTQSHDGDITMTATVSGHGRAFLAGRDQHITEG